MRFIWLSVPLCLVTLVPALGQIVSYDAASSVFPEDQGWSASTFCTPVRWLEGGFLHQDVDVGECGPPPGGDKDRYLRTLDDFIGVDGFFVEWRMHTTSTEPWGGSPGAILVAGNQGGETYWFGLARDQIKFVQDAFVVVEHIDITPDVPHTYRLEILGEQAYTIFIDGQVVLEGTPGGPYPSFNPALVWQARAWTQDSESAWAYVRYGVIPANASGDFNSDGAINGDDFYFFQECLETESGNWIGCAWADFDSDGDTDCDDWATFQSLWSGGEPAPTIPLCDCPTDLDGSGTVGSTDLALLLGAWGPNAGHPADLTGDGLVNASDLAQLLGAWGPCE